MSYEYGSDRQLSSGAIQFLNQYKVTNEKRNIYVNFILQIYNCVPLLHCDYFSCSLFDKENICNQFVLKYDKKEGKPFPGDIVSVTKINVSILTDGEHRLYTCEEIKLLEKGKKFLINPKDLKGISSKSKIESKSKHNNNDIINNNMNNSNSKTENKFEEKKEKEKDKNIKEDINIESNYNNNISEEEITNSDYSINKITNINNTNNITNINNINIDKNNSKKIEIKNNQNSEKKLKIKPQKKEEISKKEKDMIMDKINIFLDDFQDGIEISDNSNNSKEIQNQPKENIDYSLLKNHILKPPKKVKTKKQIKNNIEYKYISEIKRIIFAYQNIHCDLKFKIKCRLVNFQLGNSIFYTNCPSCKKISNKKICCNENKHILLYSFYAIMKDPSGICKVFFNNEQGIKFMGMNAQKFKELLEDKTPVGQIIFSEYKNDFYENEFMISLAFPDDIINNSKKYEVINVERINKKHRYDIVNELKNILI